MRVGLDRNGAIIISVGATSGMRVMSTAPSKTAVELARGPSMTVLSALRVTRAPSLSHNAKKP